MAVKKPPSLPAPGKHQDRAIDTIMEEESILVEYGTGVGKTLIYTLATEALVMGGEVPVLILVPNSLIEDTVLEMAKWLSQRWVDRHVNVLDGTLNINQRRQQILDSRSPVYILAHEALSYPLIREALYRRHWTAIFLDEASRFRNYSERTRTLMGLRNRSDTRYAFTGNLAPRVSSDVWYVMNWLRYGLFGTTNRKIFLNEYCLMGGYEGREPIAIRPDRIKRFRKIMDAARITCELRDIRTLPSRVLHTPRVNMPEVARKAYVTLQNTLRLEIERVNDDDFTSHVKTYATRLQRLQEICSGFARNIDGDVVYLPSAKTTAMIELLDDEPDRPTVIWGWWIPEMRAIQAALERKKIPYVRFKRDKDARQQFESGKVNVFLSQLAQGGYGLNLPRATRMIYHSLPWSLDVYLQSQERNMRMTTTATNLEIVHLVTRRSVDEYVRQKLVDRAGVSRQLTRSQALEMLST